MNCLICGSPHLNHFQTQIKPIQTYHRCSDCHFISKDGAFFLTPDEEKARYDEHQNTDSEGYRKFLSTAMNYLALDPKNKILDYGCGPTAFLSTMLLEKGIPSDHYDPNYFPSGIASENYDIVSCTEVWEHLRNPMDEIQRMLSLLRPQGELLVMTSLTDDVNFETWGYRRDSTHISFFAAKTLKVISEKFQLSWKILDKNCFVFQRLS